MEDDNAKRRKALRRHYNDTVRELVAFVRKRDKRVLMHTVPPPPGRPPHPICWHVGLTSRCLSTSSSNLEPEAARGLAKVAAVMK